MECQRYRTELASLGRGSSGAALQQQRHEIARLNSYYHSIGCGGGYFMFFGGPPPECGAIAQRINMMQANQARLSSAADSYGGESRRRQLMAAVQAACDQQSIVIDEASPRRLGGGRLVCVRTCDGSFFPLHNRPDRRGADADDMCQALCPGAETAAYSMPSGPDADLTQAVSLKGKRYTRLAGAFKYQKSFNPGCSCRKEGQSWAEALQKAETMIERERGDIVVTAKRAEELSRPRFARRAKPDPRPAEARVADRTLDVETTGSIAAEPGSLDQDRDEKRVAITSGGTKRSVRIVGPTFISLSEEAAQ